MSTKYAKASLFVTGFASISIALMAAFGSSMATANAASSTQQQQPLAIPTDTQLPPLPTNTPVPPPPGSTATPVIPGGGEAPRFAEPYVFKSADVAQVKPAPEIFLKAANLLGVAPAQCLVLEDAEKGILAAHRAGMRSVAIPNDYTRHHDFSKATRICNSLIEITPELLQSLDDVSVWQGPMN